jgi:hypothetical protein
MSLSNFQQALSDKGTTVVAAAAAASPAWLPWLKSFSEIAALLLPILGCAWLVVQFIAWIRRKS